MSFQLDLGVLSRRIRTPPSLQIPNAGTALREGCIHVDELTTVIRLGSIWVPVAVPHWLHHSCAGDSLAPSRDANP